MKLRASRDKLCIGVGEMKDLDLLYQANLFLVKDNKKEQMIKDLDVAITKLEKRKENEIR